MEWLSRGSEEGGVWVSRSGAVLDACVLYPMTLRDTLLRAAAADLYRAYWTPDIPDEVRRNLVRSGRVTQEQAAHLLSQMTTYFPEAMVTGYEHLIPTMTNHPKDRHVLAAAVVVGAQLIATDNVRDFPMSALASFGIRSQTPDEFLTELFYLDTTGMLAIIEEQARDSHKPPRTTGNVLTTLAKHAPTFTALAQQATDTA